jgi:hypothetical protein
MNRWNRSCGSIEICPVSMSTLVGLSCKVTAWFFLLNEYSDTLLFSIKDTMIFASFLEERNPFINEENLRNIETGVSATMDVKVDNAKQVGDRNIELG